MSANNYLNFTIIHIQFYEQGIMVESIGSDEENLNEKCSPRKKHKCIECDKTFSKKSNMKAHMLVHTGEKPYKCHVCANSYRQKAHLMMHIQVLHQGERPYKCKHCDYCTARKYDLKQHLLKHHMIK